MLLQRNLVYTGITRGKKQVVLIGQKRALSMVIKNDKTEKAQNQSQPKTSFW